MARILSFLLLALFISIHAGEGEDLLAKSTERFQSAKIWAMEFRVENRLADGSVQTVYKGELAIGSGDRFLLKLPGQKYVSDGITLWQVNDAQKQVVVKNTTDLDGGMHPSEVIFRYQKCKPVRVGKASFQGVPVHTVALDPTGQVKGFKSMSVWLKESDQTPVRIETLDNTGSTSIYEITKLRKNPDLGKDPFRYTPSADVEEIDMR